MHVSQDTWVLLSVQVYKIQYLSPPIQLRRPRVGMLFPQEQSLIQEEVRVEAAQGFYSSLFLVPRRYETSDSLNKFIAPHHFKMEGIHTPKDLPKKGDWMTKIDLKDAYFAQRQRS